MESNDFIDENTFVYFDPPYRPLSSTANFIAYTGKVFNDDNQRQLASYVQDLTKKWAKVLVSNSDPKNYQKEDNFFDELYAEQRICRVSAKRVINSNPNARKNINELLIRNY